MNEFSAKTICILGRQPVFGLSELESLYGANHVRQFGNSVLLDIELSEVEFSRLGGTVKVAKVLTNQIGNSWPAVEKFLLNNIEQHIKDQPQGKFTLGLSSYGIAVNVNDINKTALKLKKVIKTTGRPVRVVPNKTLDLSSAQVLHNQLNRLGGWELLAVSDGKQSILAQTIFVQDINAYASRDQARPARDARVGMLPPKLAQIIINLAIGPIKSLGDLKNNSHDKSPSTNYQLPTTILDPFCGTGVIMQEALLMNYSAMGTDLEPRMIEYSKKNLDWLCSNVRLPTNHYSLSQGDATSHQWHEPFDIVASETYLGRPLAHLPPKADLAQIVTDVNTILTKFLKNISHQTRAGTRLCLAVPAWNLGNNRFKHLPLIDQITDMGYNVVKFEHVNQQDLIYFREGQVVARQLIVLQKK